ncbi:MAG: FmdB family transcriptional regulator [SAR86 cluster bacterium]|uniref:FmdB family transcriptional regulator n=1 Tax=SAR86 cluster bacterium TaxID=2030880 RepID=A0A2A5CEA9_9GAMM|nr:MAG: FmdB family transcriptional regulator [SAR86 cluster bacterium]
MPIYEYQCESCGAHLEKLQKLSDPVLKKCPECNKDSLKKMMSATSFRLKGTGWYETDFKTGNKRHGTENNASQSDKAKDKPSSEKASAEKSDSKANASSGKTGESVKSSGNNSENK